MRAIANRRPDALPGATWKKFSYLDSRTVDKTQSRPQPQSIRRRPRLSAFRRRARRRPKGGDTTKSGDRSSHPLAVHEETRMSGRMPGSREEDAWLSDAELARCAPAETEPFQSPVPTRMVSNGEYMPYPQTEKQKRVEARIQELADSASKKVGISRRKFLAGTGGMAAAFLAMNEVFGRIFNVSPIEMFEAEAFAASGPPPNLFVLDDHTHMVRYTQTQGRGLRAIAQGP